MSEPGVVTEPGGGELPVRPSGGGDARYVPMQARVGDYALFFRKASVEITFEHDKYLVVPQSAILALVPASVIVAILGGSRNSGQSRGRHGEGNQDLTHCNYSCCTIAGALFTPMILLRR